MMELKQENQQHLIAKAQMIEEAKRTADALRSNPPEMRSEVLKKQYPELSDQEIEDLIQ
jgi:DNA-directed RNA polymerase specialized sigma24 family protein